MANQLREKRRGESVSSDYRELQKQMVISRRNYKNSCEHKPDKNRQCLPLQEAIAQNKTRESLNDYPDGSVFCTDCGEIFSMNAYTKEDLSDIVFDLKSIISQIKVLSNLNDDEYADIVTTANFIDENLDRQIFKYYIDMVNNLGGSKKKNNNNNHKGRIGRGISANQFR